MAAGWRQLGFLAPRKVQEVSSEAVERIQQCRSLAQVRKHAAQVKGHKRSQAALHGAADHSRLVAAAPYQWPKEFSREGRSQGKIRSSPATQILPALPTATVQVNRCVALPLQRSHTAPQQKNFHRCNATNYSSRNIREVEKEAIGNERDEREHRNEDLQMQKENKRKSIQQNKTKKTLKQPKTKIPLLLSASSDSRSQLPGSIRKPLDVCQSYPHAVYFKALFL